MPERYTETLEWLYHLEVSRGWDLKLESVREALSLLGSPEKDLRVLHVAGTNGKGSTAAIAQAVLTGAGLRVGLYTSPHLSDFRERIRIGNELIPSDAVVDLVDEVRGRIRGSGVELTFFEFATAVAFLHFARRGVDAAVVEVGLGGRLDATNVVVPRVAAVTTIDFDHERYLGSTLAEIAAEKAGILKPGVPAVIGRVGGEALAVLERAAAEKGSSLLRLGREFVAEPRGEVFEYRGRRSIPRLRCALAGRFQIDNAAVALAALEEGGWLERVDDELVRGAVASVEWPGRLETISSRPLVVLDGAHNPAGADALAREIPVIAAGRPVHLVFGVLADKRWEPMVERLAPLVTEAIVVPVPERRSEDPGRVGAAFAGRVRTRTAASGSEALDRLRADLAGRDEVIVVAGSLFLVGEVRAQALGTPRDPRVPQNFLRL
ncbi:MAG: bifunctional folylpolyglutamate synthase/dihydrofolate synthase [Candidatus Binatia bacterium]